MNIQLPIPAATLILFRDTGADAEHLFVERAARMSFAAGAMVFPGGRIDADDYALATEYPAFEPEEAAARIAAIRETLEETGIAVGFSPSLSTEDIMHFRQALVAGAVLSTLLRQTARRLNLELLTPWARWRPKHNVTRIFDTRFYIAHISTEHGRATVDETENVRLIWTSAAEMLASAARREVKVIFPTKRNLERLASVPQFQAAHAHAHAYSVQLIQPFSEIVDGVEYYCIPDNMGYPITRQIMKDALRG